MTATMSYARRAFFMLAPAILLIAPTFVAGQSNSDLLADQAHGVFRKHCYGCHDGGKNARAHLNVLNVASFIAADYQLVKPKSPNDSELFQLVECGTMPPGELPKL